jgi:16S rRNA processing protein RimM
MSSEDSQNSLQTGSTGSPAPGEPVFIALGFLRRTHGIYGELIMDVLTDFPERIRAGRLVYVGENHEEHKLGSVRPADKTLLVTLSGFKTPEDATRFRNSYVYARVEELPELPPGEYYHHQLVGLAVVNESGQPLGELVEVLQTGANDVYVVRTDSGGELLFPAIADVVLAVDLERQEMRVRPQDWG